MNSVAILNPTVQGLVAGAMGKAGSVANAGLFAMFFGQMLSTSEVSTDELVMQLSNMQKQQEEDGQELSMEMLAGLFINNGILPNNPITEQSNNPVHTELIGRIFSDSTGQGQQPIKQAETTSSKATSFMVKQESESSFNVVSAQVKTQSETNDDLFGQSKFKNSVIEAQKLIKSSLKDIEETSEINIEQLQSEVNAGKYNTAFVSDKSEHKISPNDVISQIKIGINKNLAAGKSEFTVKLRPEGLGEITVKLIENDSKISLSIITSSVQTAKLIGGEIEALKHVLKPLNAEIIQVCPAQNSSTSAQSHDSLFGETFAGQQQHQQNHWHHGGSVSLHTNIFTSEPEELTQQIITSKLDAYI